MAKNKIAKKLIKIKKGNKIIQVLEKTYQSVYKRNGWHLVEEETDKK
ncbi:hypothetical protein [Ornithinibacillus xuwenensis]|uniref:Uncharacterized protein n=1 Tax=Ornithinibacillus xuwenensis TaxID=3144668 RepID=A0ABU9XC51_9BACI